jgi:hypothetical protein
MYITKLLYDLRSINQYVLVPSPHEFREAPSERNFNPTSGGVHKGEILYVTFGRTACEACSATWNFGTSSAFALGPSKLTENLIDLAGRRTLRMQTDDVKVVDSTGIILEVCTKFHAAGWTC